MVSKSSGRKALRIRQAREAAARRAKIAKLFLRGVTKPTDLRDATGVCLTTVSRDLDILKTEWAEHAKKDFEAYIGLILRKIDDQEEEIWKWFDATRQDARSIKKETMDAAVTDQETGITITGRTTKTKKKQAGSGQAFKLLHACNQQRLDIVEMIAKSKGGRDATINATQINLTTISDDLLKRLKRETDAALGLNQKRLHAPKSAKEKSSENAIDAQFTALAEPPAGEISGDGGQGDAGSGGGEGESLGEPEGGGDQTEAGGKGLGDLGEEPGDSAGEPGADFAEGNSADEGDEE